MIRKSLSLEWLDYWVNDRETTAKMQADLWNDLMKKLGYTEDYED